MCFVILTFPVAKNFYRSNIGGKKKGGGELNSHLAGCKYRAFFHSLNMH